MKRLLIRLSVVAVVLAAISTAAYSFVHRPRVPIRVGILHSQTGPMAISELAVIDAELFAIEEINAKGGLLGRPVEGVIADGKSDPRSFAEAAKRLIDVEHVSMIVGCWTSACRKSVKPVVEEADHLLIYPVAFEGLENSPQIFYTGAAPNQQIIPTVTFAINDLHAKSFFLLGGSSIWPRAVSEIVKDELKALKTDLVGEVYINDNDQEFDAAIDAIIKTKPGVILNVLEGEANAVFFRKLREKGIKPTDTPIISLAVNEDEVRAIPIADLAGTYSVGSYFQSLDRPDNRAFVERYQAYQKRLGRPVGTSDAIATAYSSVMIWAQAVSDAEADDPSSVRPYLAYQSFNAPEGIISIERDNHYTWRQFAAGKIRADGVIEIIWKTNKANRPIAFPYFRKRDDWNRFLENLYQAWGRSWVAPKGAGAAVLPKVSTV